MSVIGVKGTHDVLGKEASAYTAVESLLKQIAVLYAFSEVRPPVLEHSELFVRGVGKSSDIVRKEMYTFDDKGGRSLTLRPEFTAGIMRVIIQNKLYVDHELPLKYFYCGPVFRYERPQLGRYRQFNQFGVESVGNGSYLTDLEVIVMACTMLNALGLNGVSIKINTLGDEESRNAYRDALKEYFGKYIDGMCEDCKSRYELNPLRILDCKDPEDQKIVQGAPKMSAFLSASAKERFAKILAALDEMEIPYEVDDTLVRGLDYYSDTVFEFHYVSAKGNDYGAVGAGGHYDRLMKELDGPDVPGVGFSFGIERLVSVLEDDQILPETLEPNVQVYLMPLGELAKGHAVTIASELRSAGLITEICFDDVKMGAMFKRAAKKKALYAVILGENEVNAHKVLIKDLATQEQTETDEKEIISKFSELFHKKGHCGRCHEQDSQSECCEGGCCCSGKGE